MYLVVVKRTVSLPIFTKSTTEQSVITSRRVEHQVGLSSFTFSNKKDR